MAQVKELSEYHPSYPSLSTLYFLLSALYLVCLYVVCVVCFLCVLPTSGVQYSVSAGPSVYFALGDSDKFGWLRTCNAYRAAKPWYIGRTRSAGSAGGGAPAGSFVSQWALWSKWCPEGTRMEKTRTLDLLARWNLDSALVAG